MIRITSLNKVYKSKKRKTCHAVKNVNLTLPDAGLVFVLGKSGSGKSTLLNLIGGLDSISSGTIEVDGNDLSTFKEKDFCNYRNTHIGFIFQDYHLIDELTVYENIVLSLNLRRIEDKELVKAALEKVDLAGYEDRYPTELSGGEQQRVAIARAIVKNPRIILADEPTGNLDTHTAKSIVELLKELSKDCLILIVSHNVNDANSYADRIIELAKGKIVSDKSRNPEFADEVTLENGELVYPDGLVLKDRDIDFINDNLNKRFIKRTDKFIDSTEIFGKSKKSKIENNSLSPLRELSLSGKFLKNKSIAITLSAFMVSVIMVIMALAQTIVNFDGNGIISDELHKANLSGALVQNVTTEADRALHDANNHYFKIVTEEDKAAFRDSGYTDDIYELCSYELPVNQSGIYGFAGVFPTYFQNSIFIKSTLGTLIVNEEYLERKFGSLEYVARVDEFQPDGVIITDYVADAMISEKIIPNLKNYDQLLGDYLWNGYSRGYINGIIKTDYKENYKDVISLFLSGKYNSFSELMSNDRVVKFCDSVYEKYGYCYSFNPDFKQSLVSSENINIIYHSRIKLGNNEYAPSAQYIFLNKGLLDNYSNLKDIELGPNEIVMNYGTYNKIFGTEYTYEEAIKSFTPVTLTLGQYRWDDYNYENPLSEKDVTIIQLTSHTTYSGIVGDEIFDSVVENMLFTKGLYFDGTQNIGSVISVADDLEYKKGTSVATGVYSMTRAVDVFVPIFELISIFLYIGVIFILMNFASKMINDKMHEIGILKALGTKNGSIGVVFGLQVGLIALLTCGLSTLGYYLFIDVANDILIESIHRIAPSWTLPDLQFLTFKPEIALMNCLLIFALAFVSLIFPMIKIKAIKPVKIIKAKE